MTDEEILASLESTECPACGAVKVPRMSVCTSCYSALPYGLRMALCRRVENGYVGAVRNALECLEQKKAAQVNA